MNDAMPSNQDSTQRRAWLLLAIQGKRQYAGNTGYADVHGQVYLFDNYVPNARHIQVGDVAVFRDRSGAYGFAVVQSIETNEGMKDILRCPVCHLVKIKERTTVLPRFRCRNAHEFDVPERESRKCVEYKALFGNSFITCGSVIPPMVLRGACRNFNGQLSIQQISLGILAPFIDRDSQGVLQALSVSKSILADTDAELDFYVPSLRDSRERVLRQICARRGQKQFRDALLERYGRRCVISGCGLVDILEAAHICPYRTDEDNHATNGIILRCDLHTLFDVDLLGIDPESLTIALHPHAIGYGYDEYIGQQLRCGIEMPSAEALSFRWEVFRARNLIGNV